MLCNMPLLCRLQCFVVSTLVSVTPATPFLFRNYELPAAAHEQAQQVIGSPQIHQLLSGTMFSANIHLHTSMKIWLHWCLVAGSCLLTRVRLRPAFWAASPQLKVPPASSAHDVWQAVRASSAAPYYLDDFKCGPDRCAFFKA
jgi:hypothetical protein